MVTKAHSTLTGSDLHESKGVAAAAAGQVYVTDGAGSGVFKIANAFGTQMIHVRDEEVSGANGGTPTSGVWNVRGLNTVKTNDITGASLASNQVTLPAGTYFAYARAPASQLGSAHQARLFNATDVAVLILGGVGYSNGTNANTVDAFVIGRFVLAGTKVVQLQHITNSSAVGGFGKGGSFGTEVFAELLMWKVA